MMSWWDREVHIWRLNKSSSVNQDDESLTKKRKLVAKIFIKGESNITCASLSAEGNILAVATSSDIKMFQLRPRQPEEGEGLKISKIAMASSFPAGARLLQFSPNGKWLCIIRADNQVVLARLSPSSTSSIINIHPIFCKPKRLNRHVEKFALLGGLGTYDRTLTQIAFSANSAILAVSDIAGYIDTFVLEGQEDLLQEVPTLDSDTASAFDSSDSESDSENEGEIAPKLVFGQHWTRNPSASSLPKLPSTPVVLSFRPAKTGAQKETLMNGVAPRSTRKTSNQVSHEIPNAEDRLLVVTATSDVYEFEVIKGRLSPWSRRNPTSAFPDEFRKTLEQVRGCLWDVSGDKERIWLYSIGWLWMFDLSRDFPPSSSEVVETSRKRKRKHGAGGAGGSIPDEKLSTGISRTLQHHIHEERYEEQTLINADAMDVDEDVEELEHTALSHMRKTETGDDEVEEGGKAHHWHTFKYRPILGIVEIGGGGDDEEEGPEVAIVERPIWEADLPPRYYGDQEWRDQDLSL
jgi:U3 small nucleolar RNA-associated protein 4